MKKKYLSIFVLTLIFLLLLSSIILFEIKRNSKVTILNFPMNYSLVKEQDNNIAVVSVYVDNKTDYLKKDTINKSYLYSKDNYDSYFVIVDNINQIDEQFNLDGKAYDRFDLSIIIPFITTDITKIEDAYLHLEYKNNKELIIKVGNICFVNRSNTSSTRVKIVSSIVNTNSLSEINVDLLLPMNKNIEIVDIKTVSSIVDVCWKKILVRETGNLISERLLTDNLMITDEYQNKITLSIPLEYLKNQTTNQVGLIVSLKENGVLKELIIKPYPLFKMAPNYNQISIKTYEH